MRQLILMTATAIGVLGAAATVQAQSAAPTTQSVEVRGAAPVRTDVATLCPDIANDLPDALAAIARQRSEAALIEVQFALDGSAIADVQTQGGGAAYQRAVRRAVRGLDCRSPEAGRQTVRLRVRFVDPFAQPQGRLARVEVQP